MSAGKYYDKVARQYSRMITCGVGGNLKIREKNSLITLLSPTSGDAILDAGCGSGYYAEIIRKTGANVFCIDISQAMVEVVRRSGIEAEVQDIQSLDLGRKFDKILCAGPLEFCKDPLGALKNVRQHLNDEGLIVLSTLHFSIMGLVYWFYHLSHGLRIHLYSLGEITSLLNQAEFSVEVVERPTSFLFVIRARPQKNV